MEKRTKITVRDLNLYYGENHALKDVNMNIRENCVTAFIGPSGCGKSTFLKTINRMNDLVDGVRITGEVKLDDEDTASLKKRYKALLKIYHPDNMHGDKELLQAINTEYERLSRFYLGT